MAEHQENSREQRLSVGMERGIGVAACVASLAGGIGLGYILDRIPTVSQTSEITCSDGEPFVGAYVKTLDEKGEAWAQWDSITPDGSKARITVTLPENTPYHLNVGCGGTKDEWERKPTTPEVVAKSNIHYRFVCDASKLAANNCVVVP